MQRSNALFLATLLLGFLGAERGPRRAHGAPAPETAGLEDAPATTDKVRFKGRVFVRSTLQSLDSVSDPAIPDKSLDLSVPSARLGLEYSLLEWLSLVVEVEFADRPRLQDGFLLSKLGHFVVQAGQLKMPVSAIEYTSPWRLPVARRGLMHDLLQDHMQLAGRRPGVLFEMRNLGAIDLKLSAGAFQGSVWAGDDYELARNQSLENQNLVLRAAISPGSLDIGAYFESRTFAPAGTFARFWTAGLDAIWEKEWGTTGVRAWAEAMTGSSWIDDDYFDGRYTTFIAGRAIVAWRYGGIASASKYVEPYCMIGSLDPNREIESDLISEVAAGINAGHWKKTRLTVEFGMTRAGTQIPMYLKPNTQQRPVAYDGKSVVLQVGAAL